MKDCVLTSPIVAAVIIVVLILFGVGFCIAVLLLQAECEKNERLRERNLFLRERLSETQQALNSRGYKLPGGERDVQMLNNR